MFKKPESEKAAMPMYKSMFSSLFLIMMSICFSFSTTLEFSQLMFSRNHHKSRFCSSTAIVS